MAYETGFEVVFIKEILVKRIYLLNFFGGDDFFHLILKAEHEFLVVCGGNVEH